VLDLWPTRAATPGGSLGRMKVVLDVLGWVLAAQGGVGVANALLGWWRWADDLLLVNQVPLLAGYEVFASILIGVLGLAVLGISGSIDRKREG
jgi:hypothetical protein